MVVHWIQFEAKLLSMMYESAKRLVMPSTSQPYSHRLERESSFRPFVPSSPYYNHDVPVRSYNPVYATQLLQEAGFKKVDGVWEKEQTLSLRIIAHKRLESSQEVVINLQSQLKSQGIEVFVDFLDEAMWKANIWRGQDYDLLLSKWSFDRNEDVRNQLHSRGGLNFTGYDIQRR